MKTAAEAVRLLAAGSVSRREEAGDPQTKDTQGLRVRSAAGGAMRGDPQPRLRLRLILTESVRRGGTGFSLFLF